MAKTIVDLRAELEMDRDLYQYTVENSSSQVSRDVCYGKLDVIHKVLTFLEENDL